MMIFNDSHKMAYLVRTNYHLLPVINRFNIRLGFKNKTVLEICQEKKIDTGFFLAIVNTYHNEDYFPEEELLSFSPILIIDYLRKTHRYYLDYLLPKIEELLQGLITGCEKEYMELDMLETFYAKYKNEFLLHIQDEEEKQFPYIEKLVKEYRIPEEKYSIHAFEQEHSNVDMKLNDLKSLLIKYIEPVYDDNICNEFLGHLSRFENDVKDHARIEDKILIPQVLSIEKELGK